MSVEKQEPTGSTYRDSLIRRLGKSPETRARWAESNLDKTIAFQIRSLRDREEWTQAEFAEKLGITHPNNVSARLENPNYGKHTLTTLKKIAATCDVALVVWFVPYSRLIAWSSHTPYVDHGLSPEFYEIPAYDKDDGLARDKEKKNDIDINAGLGALQETLGSASNPFPKFDRQPMERPHV